MRGISWLAEDPSGSQEGLYPIQLLYFLESAVMELSCQFRAPSALSPRIDLPVPVAREWFGLTQIWMLWQEKILFVVPEMEPLVFARAVRTEFIVLTQAPRREACWAMQTQGRLSIIG